MKKKSKQIVLNGIIASFVIVTIAAIIPSIINNFELENKQNEFLEELETNKGTYDEKSIVLQNTSKVRAEQLADELGARLRITNNGDFATLTLPGETTIIDVVKEESNRKLLEEISIDYQAKIADSEYIEKEFLPAKPNYTVNDEYYSQQTYLDYINIGDSWSNSRNMGGNITIAVIDTGIDTDHIEFQGRISEYSYNATYDKIVKDYVLEDGSLDWSLVEDEQGHGTAVTGVIASSMDSVGITGILPRVNILTIKAECTPSGSFSRSSDLVFGLYYAIERDVKVVNMSFVGGSNLYSEPALLAVDSDIICVAASGNESTSILTYPAADPNVIGVGALANESFELSDYSNYGENNDIVAPGTVYTTKNDGTYQILDGTSFSSPIVAAGIGLYLSSNKYQTFEDVCERLYASTKDLGTLGKDYIYGYGALDVNALICEEVGTVTFNMLTDELDNTKQLFIRNHALQNLPEPERLYSVFDGWYYDIHCTEELNWYEDEFTSDLTLYAKWVNIVEEGEVPFNYVEIADGTIEITGYKGKRRYITIPNKIEGKVVSSIGPGSFTGETRLRQVNLPNQLKYIKDSAFEGCSLLSIAIPDSVIEIGKEAFKDNIRLSYVSVSEDSNLKIIGTRAFNNCSSLILFDIPKNVSKIDGTLFLGCTSIRKFNVASSNKFYSSKDSAIFTKSKESLIVYPSSLTGEYLIPENVKILEKCAFAYSRLTNINFSNVEYIAENCFSYSKLVDVKIPDSVIEIEHEAFFGCSSLNSVYLGNGLAKISSSLFECSNLTSIFIPNSISVIGEKAFYCSNLNEIVFEENSNLMSIEGEAFFSTRIEEIIIPSSVIKICYSAFENCINLKTVEFEKESNLHMIGDKAFANTSSLKKILLPSNLSSIGGEAFKSSGISGDIILPASLNYLGEGAFASCYNLENIYVEDGNENYVDEDGVVYNYDKTEIIEYPAGNIRTEYTMPNSVINIGGYAFSGSYYLEVVNPSNNLKTIKKYGFEKCKSLKKFIMPDTVEIIEEHAFSYCTNIKYYQLSNSLKSIGSFAFEYNKSLESIHIPDNVMQISNYAFYYDYALRNITFNETAKIPRLSYACFAYCGIYEFRVPSNVSTISQYVFEGCYDLTSITFAENSKLESVSAYLFLGCESLQTITFEEGSKLINVQAHAFEGIVNLVSIDFGNAKVNNIDNYAFRYCESLENISLPEEVTYIGRYAFYGCETLSEIVIPYNVEYIGQNAFYLTNNINVYFKSEILPLYLQENWDNGIGGYYLSTSEVVVNGDFEYTLMSSGNVAIVKYNGNATNLNLRELNLGGDIISIGGYAFYRSTVQSITLPNTLTSIQRYAFAYSNIKEIIIPDGVSFIGQYAFYNSELSSVIFEDNSSVHTIEQYAFSSLDNLNEIVIPNSVVNLGTAVFKESGLTSLIFEKGTILEEIPEEAFLGTKIESVVIPDSVALINHNAFRDNLCLTNVTFGIGKLQIMSNVFYNTGLVEVYINENIEYIGEYAFVGLTNLTSFSVSKDNPYYTEIDGALFTKDGRKVIAYPAGRTGEIVLPESLEIIGFGAFENSLASTVTFNENCNLLTLGYRSFFNASNLTEINIPKSVVSIDYYAFAYCSNLRTVNFEEGNKLTGIYEGAFYGCTRLTNIKVPNTVVEISDFTFYGCKSLKTLPFDESVEIKGIYSYAFAYTGITELKLPETLIDIGDYAFKGTKIREVVIPETNKKQLILGIGIFEDCNELESITLPFIGASFEDPDITWFGYIFGAGSYKVNNSYIPDSLKRVEIFEGITEIGVGAFYGVTTIEYVEIPYSISAVYQYSFYNSHIKYELVNEITFYDQTNTLINKITDEYIGENIIGIKLSEAVTSINETFRNCKSLQYIILPKYLISIDAYAFSGCEKLATVIIPEGVTIVKKNAFENCINLQNIIFPNTLLTIENSALLNCESLEFIVLPESLEIIGFGAFEKCYNLTSIKLPTSISKIAGAAFADCVSLTIVQIPENIKTIDGSAFYNCTKLEKVGFSEGLNSIGEYAFYNCINLQEIVIPNSVEMIGDGAFAQCHNLTKIELSKNLFTIENNTFQGCVNLVEIKNTEQITKIGYEAFTNCSSIKTLIFNDLIEIGAYAFAYCNNLKTFSSSSLPKEIKSGVFQYCSSLEFIEITEGVNIISNCAFNECTNLKSITFPSTITYIGAYAFWLCENLEKVNVKDISSWASVEFKDIYSNPLCYAEKLYFNDQLVTSIEIPEGVTKIENYAFYRCINLTKVVLPSTLTSIGEKAFYYCDSFYELINNSDMIINLGDVNNGYIGYYPDIIKNKDGSYQYRENFEIINEEGFYFTYSAENGFMLTAYLGNQQCITLPKKIYDEDYSINFRVITANEVIIPEGFTSINYGAFYNCSLLEKITIPNGVAKIEDNAFSRCVSLKDIVLPETLISIGSNVFNECVSLTKLSIPKSVNNIGNDSFSNCSNLQKIECTFSQYCNNASLKDLKKKVSFDFIEDFSEYIIENDCIYSLDYKTLYYVDINFEESFSVNDNTEIIDSYAFAGCKKITEILIPESVISIRDYAFSECSSLIELIIPDNVNGIRKNAFEYCDSLVSVVLSKNISYLAPSLFYNCSSLTNIIIPENVTLIDNLAFANCRSLKEIIIPNNVTSIGPSCFSGCSSLFSIKLPNSISKVSDWLFANCSSLTTVELPETIEIISYGAFENCNNLSMMILPEALVEILGRVFYNCSSLKDVIISTKVTSIAKSVFEGCNDLENVFYNGTLEQWINIEFQNYTSNPMCYANNFYSLNEEKEYVRETKVVFSNKIEKIGQYQFYGMSQMMSIILPESVIKIGVEAFSHCSSLVSIEIPESVTEIGNGAFSHCSSLVSIEIPESVTEIGSGAFRYCSSLFSIEIPKNVTEIGSHTFGECSSLLNVVLPKNILSIGGAAFYDCKSLTNVYYYGSIEQWNNIEMEESFTSNPMYYGENFYLFVDNSWDKVLELIISGNISTVNDGQFYGFDCIEKITFSEGVININKYAFYNCINLSEVILPSTLINIGEYAFCGCNSLYEITNNSDLNLECGSLNYGWIAYNAILIFEKNGGTNNKNNVNSIDGFLYKYDIYEDIILYGYIGNEECITLPLKIEEKSYVIRFEILNASEVVIPEGITSLSHSAFRKCENLKKITLPNTLIDIGDEAFYGCKNLSQIIFPNTLTNIGDSSFRECSSLIEVDIPDSVRYISSNTFKDCFSLINVNLPNNISYVSSDAFEGCHSLNFYKENNCVYLGNENNKYLVLFDVEDEAEELVIKTSTRITSSLAFENVTKLRHVEMPLNFMDIVPINNIETILINESRNLFGYNIPEIMTLKNVIIKKEVQIKSNSYFFYYRNSNISIFVEEQKENVMWDYDYPNWNNGNKVYYGGEWITASFYDENKEFISRDYYSINQVIRQPYYEVNEDKLREYSFVGWDTNNDGLADFIPATSSVDIEAYAVITDTAKTYTVDFYSEDRRTLLYAFDIPYGSEISLPEDPTKEGYNFLGWEGYSEDIIVTENYSFYATFEHIGGEHSYKETVINSTCEEQGYTLHHCDICGYEYKDNYQEIVEHTFEEWVTDLEPTCEEYGHKFKICTICDYVEEETINPVDHDYVGETIKESTCEEHGITRYTCSKCNDVIEEEKQLKQHNYVKKYVSRTWLEILIDLVLDIFFGYEGDKAFYYECSECNKIYLTSDKETSLFSVASTNCHHESSTWEEGLIHTCENSYLFNRCDDCDEILEVKTIEGFGHDLVYYEGTDATCLEEGLLEYYYCKICDEKYDKELNKLENVVIPTIGHTYSDWYTVEEATCFEAGLEEHTCHCGHSETRVIEALGHDLTYHDAKEATCLENGNNAYEECNRCDYTTYEEIPAHGHSYESVVTNPTCIEEGYTTHTCEYCSDTYVDTYVAPHGHDMQPATYDEPSKCSICGHTEGEPLKPSGGNTSSPNISSGTSSDSNSSFSEESSNSNIKNSSSSTSNNSSTSVNNSSSNNSGNINEDKIKLVVIAIAGIGVVSLLFVLRKKRN